MDGQQGRFKSLLHSKRVVIAVVAATGMLLGTMSIGTAVVFSRSPISAAGSQAAPANPFAGASSHSGRHSLEETAPSVPGATDASNHRLLSFLSGDSADSDNPAQNQPTLPSPPAPLTIPLGPAIQPTADTLMQLTEPITAPPVRDSINGFTGRLPTQLEAGPLKIELPSLHL